MSKKRALPKKKFYLVLSERSNYTHGAFPHSEEGLILAKSFIKKKESSVEKYYIIEK